MNVNSARSTAGPLIPQLLTFERTLIFDAKCQFRTHALQQGRLYSITSSAMARSFDGTSMPGAFAVLRLITGSNLVGCCNGRSVGLAPLRMGATYWTSTGRPTALAATSYLLL